MEYNQLIQTAKKFNFIGENEQQANAAVKATMGIIASRMSEDDARDFANSLPEPLTLEKLRSHQEYENDVNPSEHFKVIATQFNINEEEAQRMVKDVLHTATENLSEEQFNSWKQKLPQDWSSFMDEVKGS
jgi:uncharacterized protein (DUF2267 family)